MAQVSVTLNSAGNIVVNPDPVHCHHGEQLTWTTQANATLSVAVPQPPPHPFTTPPPYQSATVGGSIVVQVQTSPTLGSHPYTVSLQIGSKTHDLDPTIIIDPGLGGGKP